MVETQESEHLSLCQVHDPALLVVQVADRAWRVPLGAAGPPPSAATHSASGHARGSPGHRRSARTPRACICRSAWWPSPAPASHPPRSGRCSPATARSPRPGPPRVCPDAFSTSFNRCRISASCTRRATFPSSRSCRTVSKEPATHYSPRGLSAQRHDHPCTPPLQRPRPRRPGLDASWWSAPVGARPSGRQSRPHPRRLDRSRRQRGHRSRAPREPRPPGGFAPGPHRRRCSSASPPHVGRGAAVTTGRRGGPPCKCA